MTKKKLFIALSIGSFALAGAAAVAFTGNHIGFIAANETEYRAVLSEGNSKTDLGNELKLVTEGLTESAGNYGLLAAGGRIDVEVNGAKSIVVNADNHANLTLSLGYKEGVWYKEDLTEWIVEDDAIVELNDRPNYVRIEATADTVIESITYNYSCEPTLLNSFYFNYGADWGSANAWFWGHAWNDKGTYYDSAAVEYLGNYIYRYEIPSIFKSLEMYRMDPNGDEMKYSYWNTSGELKLDPENNCFTFGGWNNQKFTASKFDATSVQTPNYGLLGKVKGVQDWDNECAHLALGEDGVWSVELDLLAKDEFKIRENDSWSSSFGKGTARSNYIVSEAGKYIVSLEIIKHAPEIILTKVA